MQPSACKVCWEGTAIGGGDRRQSMKPVLKKDSSFRYVFHTCLSGVALRPKRIPMWILRGLEMYCLGTDPSGFRQKAKGLSGVWGSGLLGLDFGATRLRTRPFKFQEYHSA